MALLLLPIVQQLFHPLSVKKLNGVLEATDAPKLTLENYKNVTFQSQLEKYVSERFGFHELVIRIYNQYLWFFRKTYSADVVIGKDKWLYGKRSVYDHYRQEAYLHADDNETLVKIFDRSVARLKRVQQELDKCNTKLFVLICPSKDIICPEHLPENGNYVMGDGIRAVEYIPKAFVDKGINFLDLNAWFKQMKDTISYPVFPKTGMHWSNVAAMHASDTLIRYLEWLTRENLLNIQIGPMYPGKAVKPDDDLEKTLNLLFPIKPNQHYYADVKVVADTMVQRPKLISIGDSFFWNLSYVMPMDSIFCSHPFWYYYSSVYYDSCHKKVNELNVEKEVENADVVMIIVTANHLYNFDMGFVSHMDKALFNPSPEIVEDILLKMEADSVWFQSLKEKAEKKRKTLDEVMRDDALYLIMTHPESYDVSQNLK